MVVRIGDYDLSTDAENNPSYDVKVLKITCHPGTSVVSVNLYFERQDSSLAIWS